MTVRHLSHKQKVGLLAVWIAWACFCVLVAKYNQDWLTTFFLGWVTGFLFTVMLVALASQERRRAAARIQQEKP